MEGNMIADDQITASSEWYGSRPVDHGANNARLNRPSQFGSVGAWCSLTKDLNQWIQVDLVLPTWVTGVLTQGREDQSDWVTEYKVEYSSSGQNWMYVQYNDDHEGTVGLT